MMTPLQLKVGSPEWDEYKRTGCLSASRANAVRRPQAGEMNGTERAYAEELEARRLSGQVARYMFEAIKLKLAPSTYYTPDFIVWAADESIELHEVKGFWRDDARVKIKVAAAFFPMFHFVAVSRIPKADGSGWRTELF